MSRSAMPLALMAASTDVICFAFASPASRAVFSWLVTPIRMTAVSGATPTVASPVTVTVFSTASADANANAAPINTIKIRNTTIASLHRHKNVHHQFVGRSLYGIRGVFLDEKIFRLELLVIEKVGDRFVRRIHGVIGTAVDELDGLSGRCRPDLDVALRGFLRHLRDRQAGLVRKSRIVGLRVHSNRRTGRLDVLLVEIFLQ